MKYCIQSHFGAPLGLAACQQIRAFGFDMCRIDAQQTTPDDLVTILAEVHDAGLQPLVIVNKPVPLPAQTHVQWFNQFVQSNTITDSAVNAYCHTLETALSWAAAQQLQLWIPTVDNLHDTGGLLYIRKLLRACPDLPPTVGISANDYDDEGGLDQLKAIIGPRPFAITEFGYSAHKNRWKFWNPGLSDFEAAEKIRRRWIKLAAQGATIASLYQRVDGTAANDRWGIYRTNGTIKPQAYTIP